MKIVINVGYGGFSLPPGLVLPEGYSRSDPLLVQAVEGRSADYGLKIVEVPDDVKWHIEEYDGDEWVAEDHRTWR